MVNNFTDQIYWCFSCLSFTWICFKPHYRFHITKQQNQRQLRSSCSIGDGYVLGIHSLNTIGWNIFLRVIIIHEVSFLYIIPKYFSHLRWHFVELSYGKKNIGPMMGNKFHWNGKTSHSKRGGFEEKKWWFHDLVFLQTAKLLIILIPCCR